jgi:hypothetical protein
MSKVAPNCVIFERRLDEDVASDIDDEPRLPAGVGFLHLKLVIRDGLDFVGELVPLAVERFAAGGRLQAAGVDRDVEIRQHEGHLSAIEGRARKLMAES